MQTPYEIAVKSVIPALRGMIAKELVRLNYTQVKIAEMLDVTQPAVSKYLASKRGNAIHFDGRDDVVGVIRKLSKQLADEKLSSFDLMREITEMVNYVLSKGYVCELHFNYDPELRDQNCSICMQLVT